MLVAGVTTNKDGDGLTADQGTPKRASINRTSADLARHYRTFVLTYARAYVIYRYGRTTRQAI